MFRTKFPLHSTLGRSLIILSMYPHEMQHHLLPIPELLPTHGARHGQYLEMNGHEVPLQRSLGVEGPVTVLTPYLILSVTLFHVQVNFHHVSGQV